MCWLLVNTCLQVLGTLCSKVPNPQLLQASGVAILAALELVLKGLGSSSALRSTERQLQSGLRALNTILMAAQSKHGLNLIDLVEALRQCFTFGIQLGVVSSVASPVDLAFGSASTQSTPGVGQAPTHYRPPHRRQSSSNSAGELFRYFVLHGIKHL